MITLEIWHYLDLQGRNPYANWFDGLRDVRAQARIDARLARVRAGLFGDCKPVGQNVLELRVDYGPGYRVYLARHSGQVVILLGGGDKRRQSGDIAGAIARWQDFKRRNT